MSRRRRDRTESSSRSLLRVIRYRRHECEKFRRHAVGSQNCQYQWFKEDASYPSSILRSSDVCSRNTQPGVLPKLLRSAALNANRVNGSSLYRKPPAADPRLICDSENLNRQMVRSQRVESIKLSLVVAFQCPATLGTSWRREQEVTPTPGLAIRVGLPELSNTTENSSEATLK